MAIKCELCGGTEFVKNGGMFVCKKCNTEYSPEEAKKMMGDFEIDSASDNNNKSEELENLYELARRAKNDGNDENALKFYEQILINEPSSWEPNFYTTYFQVIKCKIGEIGTAAVKLKNSEKSVLELLHNDNNLNNEAKINAIKEMSDKMSSICLMLFSGYKNHYDGISLQIRSRYNNEVLTNCGASMLALYNFGDEIINIFGTEFCPQCAVDCWKVAIQMHMALRRYYFVNKESTKNAIIKYVEKIKKYEPDYIEPDFGNSGSSGGCYVATAVYGSYDCPQVWTLRRYRDYSLAETWYGRAFIHTYYAISPTLVKWFGHTEWFKKMWRGKLDRMVKSLREKGFEDTPYEDKHWK